MSRRFKYLIGGAVGIVAWGMAMASPYLLAREVSPVELKQNLDLYDGKIVKVRGWVERCAEMDCMIVSDPDHARLFERAHGLLDEAVRVEGSPAADRAAKEAEKILIELQANKAAKLFDGLSVGEAAWFDPRMQTLLRRRVVLTGRFDAHCLRPGVACLDRVPELTPARLFPPYAVESSS